MLATRKTRIEPLLLLMTLAAALLGAGAASAAQPIEAIAARRPSHAQRRWTLDSDNDLFAFTHNDRDYTAGVSVTFTDSQRANAEQAGPCERTERRCLHLGLPAPVRAKALKFGLLLFTPQDLAAEEPLMDDRPYASLLYGARSRLGHAALKNVAYQTTLTVGLLGLDLAERIHRSVHVAVGATLPAGYSHQISAGGEPTFRYARSRYRLLSAGRFGRQRYALRLDRTVSVGFLTEANAELAFRWGSRQAQWWESFSDEGDYAGQPLINEPAAPTRRRMTFELTAGIELRGRLYDAFLQGQFRHSDVAYASSDVEHVLGEAWLGVDMSFNDRLRVSYVVRRQTQELNSGRGARAFTWAALSISRGIG